MRDIPKVYLLIETSRGFGRGLIRGIIRWAQLHGNYMLIGSTGPKHDLPVIGPKENAGIIAALSTPDQCIEIQKLGIPFIALQPTFENLDETKWRENTSTIVVDDAAAAKMIAEYFVKNGFKRFAYCGLPNNSTWSELRKNSYMQYLEQQGFDCEVYSCSQKPDIFFQRKKDSTQLAQWLHSLASHTAIMACNDDRGQHILEVCRQEEIVVPEQLAIIGVDNDDIVCSLTIPTLSSVALDVESCGFRVMEHLAEMMTLKMCRKKVISKVISIDPLYISERRSSDIYFFNFPAVSKSLQYIKENFLYPICVSDVVNTSGVSRRTLERQFMDIIGHSVHDEIANRRFERAKQLLLNTDHPMVHVAIQSGFTQLRQMLRAFHKCAGCSPSEFRAGISSDNN